MDVRNGRGRVRPSNRNIKILHMRKMQQRQPNYLYAQSWTLRYLANQVDYDLLPKGGRTYAIEYNTYYQYVVGVAVCNEEDGYCKKIGVSKARRSLDRTRGLLKSVKSEQKFSERWLAYDSFEQILTISKSEIKETGNSFVYRVITIYKDGSRIAVFSGVGLDYTVVVDISKINERNALVDVVLGIRSSHEKERHLTRSNKASGSNAVPDNSPIGGGGGAVDNSDEKISIGSSAV